ncbi:HARBI1 [Mytilus coruscus]|uniref:HARBI1 n=1 Tax=Mytilus coruscus TaxID=42192 RepID=A0A6J8E803_MYTCO|nr:HARBI1 [Mytilus coruscus]
MAFQVMFQPNNNAIRRERIFRDRTHPLDVYDDFELIRRYRMPREAILNIVDILTDDLEPKTMGSHSVPASLQVLTALIYYARGSFQQVVGDFSRTSRALAAKVADFIKFPLSPWEQLAVKQGFSSEFNMPNTVGCIDGTLIAIKRPTEREDAYVCRKMFHALNVQGVCDNKKQTDKSCCQMACMYS